MTRSRFFGYPSQPTILGQSIEAASKLLNASLAKFSIRTWPQVFTYGEFIDTNVLGAIDESELSYFDITVPNFNVFFEVGYAVGRAKPVICLVNQSLAKAGSYLTEIGLFDNAGLGRYNNSGDLLNIISIDLPPRATQPPSYDANFAQPLYVLKSKAPTEGMARAISALTDNATQFRAFDPSEDPRMALRAELQQVAESTGVMCSVLNTEILDAENHNLRAAFLAGAALAMDRELLLLDMSGKPLPLDVRDYAKDGSSLERVVSAVQSFALRSLSRLQRASPQPTKLRDSAIQRISLGNTAAENESRRLSEYFVETAAYRAASEGEGRILIGRKGSGKTAIFMEMTRRLSEGRRNLIVPLKPDGYQLRKFKDSLVNFLSEGTKEHTVAAFWEYLLLLEICHQCIRDDVYYIGRDPAITRLLPALRSKYGNDEYILEGDFSERTILLLNQIQQRFRKKYPEETSGAYLSRSEITEIVYSHDIGQLRSDVIGYLAVKERVVVLVDNLDKGWEANGVSPNDILMLRTLIDVGRKIERALSKLDIPSFCLIFLRNDIYELLLDDTPDRGKEGKVAIDWTDRELLKLILRRRLQAAQPTAVTWGQIAASHVEGRGSLDWLIDRSLMRPRYLLELVNRCLGSASSRNHDTIQEADFKLGYQAFSLDALVNTNLEIRDVNPLYFDAIFALKSLNSRTSRIDISLALLNRGFTETLHDGIVKSLIWYGVLGVMDELGEATFIYEVEYNSHVLEQTRSNRDSDSEVFEVNKAFWPALKINSTGDTETQMHLL